MWPPTATVGYRLPAKNGPFRLLCPFLFYPRTGFGDRYSSPDRGYSRGTALHEDRVLVVIYTDSLID